MRVGEPNQAQKADQHDLAENRVTIAKKREQPTNEGRFDEIHKVHITLYSI